MNKPASPIDIYSIFEEVVGTYGRFFVILLKENGEIELIDTKKYAKSSDAITPKEKMDEIIEDHIQGERILVGMVNVIDAESTFEVEDDDEETDCYVYCIVAENQNAYNAKFGPQE